MNTRLIATLSALSLSAFAGVSANAEQATSELAWQQPGYVTEVVIVTAPRPKAPEPAMAAADGVLAWQEPGYVEEVVVVMASRREVLAAARWTEVPPPVWRQLHMGTTAK
ncbi:MAG TPA: hypothetical protein VMR74_09200 [Gammaproteobacteria bacterium]|nr:hypothetical protein [Gammaproteobacteria bacterium]